MPAISEKCLVALTLSGVVRLYQSFERSSSSAEKQKLLQVAADLLDRTVPFPDLKAELLKAGTDPVLELIKGRERIAAIPPSLWRPPKAKLNEVSPSHYQGLRALDRALKKEFSRPDMTWDALSAWLTPAWAAVPELAHECQELKSYLGLA
jgi:hypothetical protein